MQKVIEVSNDGLVDQKHWRIVLQDKRNDDDERLKEFRAEVSWLIIRTSIFIESSMLRENPVIPIWIFLYL